jgi:transposase
MAPTKDSTKDSLSRRRAELIIKVRAGRMTAKEAAAALGVSRKTYYEWEERALQGMLSALENGTPGRPPSVTDEEKEALKNRVEKLETTLEAHRTALKVRELLGPAFERTESGARKTPAKKNERRRR